MNGAKKVLHSYIMLVRCIGVATAGQRSGRCPSNALFFAPREKNEATS